MGEGKSEGSVDNGVVLHIKTFSCGFPQTNSLCLRSLDQRNWVGDREAFILWDSYFLLSFLFGVKGLHRYVIIEIRIVLPFCHIHDGKDWQRYGL